MDPEVQSYLVEELITTRSIAVMSENDVRLQLATFSGALMVLRRFEMISPEEHDEWRNRMLVALDIVPSSPHIESARGFTSGAIGGRRSVDYGSARAKGVRRFVRSIAGPEAEAILKGSSFRIIAAEIYDVGVTIRWRIAPEPDVRIVLHEEFERLEQELEGLGTERSGRLRRMAENRLMHRMYRFTLGDDVGTNYRARSQRSGGSPEETIGESDFEPAPPLSATVLRCGWIGAEVAVALE